MDPKFIKLYTSNSLPDAAFFLTSGTVFFYASAADKYAITGKNLILGSTELIMNSFASGNKERVETAVAEGTAEVKRMTVPKFLEGMKTYSFILNVSMVLARQVLMTNQILKKNLSTLTGEEKKVRECSIEYYSIMSRLLKEYDKRKLPWLKALIKNYETSLTLKKGEAFSKSSEPTKISTGTALSDKTAEYPRGSVICEENTHGEEMYILQTGVIDVSIGGNRVATIEEPGTVIGEMALLLGEKRTATLVAKNSVVITKIQKSDLKEIAEKQFDILQAVAASLAKRHYYNVIKIGSVNKSLLEQSVDVESGTKKPVQSQSVVKDLITLKRGIEEAVKGKDVSFMEDLLKSF